jgi:RNA polymerase sigma-70 factor (ECF subfamily)
MQNTEITEVDAIELAKNGDVTGYNVLYHLHKRRVYAWCLRSTRNVPDAEDLTQEVFLQVFRKISTFRSEATFGSWLYRVTFNLAGMHARKRPHDVSLTSFDSVKPDTVEVHTGPRGYATAFALERAVLAQAISSLSKAKRAVILLHDVEGLTHGEVASHLGVAVSTSKSQLCRARLILRNALGSTEKQSRGAPQRSSSNAFAAVTGPLKRTLRLN